MTGDGIFFYTAKGVSCINLMASPLPTSCCSNASALCAVSILPHKLMHTCADLVPFGRTHCRPRLMLRTHKRGLSLLLYEVSRVSAHTCRFDIVSTICRPQRMRRSHAHFRHKLNNCELLYFYKMISSLRWKWYLNDLCVWVCVYLAKFNLPQFFLCSSEGQGSSLRGQMFLVSTESHLFLGAQKKQHKSLRSYSLTH